jgi:hypothetical protein
MPTLLRPMSTRTHPQHSTNARTSSMAQRLGVSDMCLLDYLAANGGAPDGMERSQDLVTEFVDQRLARRALPERAGPHAHAEHWVKRDRPRYFIPG